MINVTCKICKREENDAIRLSYWTCNDEGHHQFSYTCPSCVLEASSNQNLRGFRNTEVKVLDHGLVRLVDYMGGDISVVRAARVSYNEEWRAGENEGSDQKLINYLWKNKHTTPFEAVTFTFEVKAPIFVFRQWHRHRTQSYNELSARYRELPEEYYVPVPEIVGTQAIKNKQGREIKELTEDELETLGYEIDRYKRVIKDSFRVYQDLLNCGWPKELARNVLPVATYSHMFCTVNLLNLFKFLSLRNHSHAQYEIRVYAEAIEQLIKPIVPVCFTAYRSTVDSVLAKTIAPGTLEAKDMS